MDESLVKSMYYEFHTASYHSLIEVVTALRIVADHLTMHLNESNPDDDTSDLELRTVPQFMLTLYKDIKKDSEVLEEIGIHSLTSSQLDCIIVLPLPGLYACLCQFVQWISDGTYDFCSLPFSHKTKMSHADQAALQEIPHKWQGTVCHAIAMCRFTVTL